MVKIRTGALAVLLVFGAIMYFPEIQGWYGGDKDDDGKRTIQLIGLASNDSMRVEVLMLSSINGYVLSLHNEEIGNNSWDYEYEAQATEHVRISFDAWVQVVGMGDKSSVRCKIIDDGQVVSDDRAVAQDKRMSTQATCAYNF